MTIQPEEEYADLLSVLSSGGSLHRFATLQGTKSNILSKKVGYPALTIEEDSEKNKYYFTFNSVDFVEYQQF